MQDWKDLLYEQTKHLPITIKTNTMKQYEVKGWYRYADNEKDYEYAKIIAENEQMVIMLFKDMFTQRFFAIDIKEIS